MSARRCEGCSHDLSEYAPGLTLCAACEQASEAGTCRYCGAPITRRERQHGKKDGHWRDDSEDPGDGWGGDASCGGREWPAGGPSLGHEPAVES